ncbi:MAG: hypothetical protein RLZZ618_2208 [Pseudomonadota bacterium]|jgi:uncharacterized protein YfaP (DUF2135 family)
MELNSKSRAWAAAPALAVSLLLGACGGGGDSAPAPATAVEGTVLDASTGTPVANASVQSGAASATTGADGKFTLSIAANARAVLRISKTAYAENVVVTPVADAQTTTVLAQLLPVAATTAISTTGGGTATVPNSTARVVIGGGSLVRADGLPISGQVSVAVTPINPAVNPSYMPGDFRAIRAGTGPSSIESFGAMTVTLADATGARVNIATGRTASIRIPLTTRGTPTPTIPLFYFDTATGLWVEEGTASLAGTAPNQYYEGNVSHFSTWNADQYVNTVNVTGCLQDDRGNRVAGARVTSDGVNYSGTAMGVTDASGNFSVPMKRAATGILTAQSGLRFSNSLTVGPSDVDFIAQAAPACLVLGSISNGLTIKLTWGTSPSDVDSYLFAPNGDTVWYGEEGSLNEAPFAALDVDDTTSFGPEIVTVRRLMVGTYKYVVNNYSGTFAPGITGSPTRVELTSIGESRVFTPPAGEGANEWWNVFNFTVDAQCRITITPVATWSAVEPAPAAAATPVYCTAP